jgi:hypothetical protein
MRRVGGGEANVTHGHGETGGMWAGRGDHALGWEARGGAWAGGGHPDIGCRGCPPPVATKRRRWRRRRTRRIGTHRTVASCTLKLPSRTIGHAHASAHHGCTMDGSGVRYSAIRRASLARGTGTAPSRSPYRGRRGAARRREGGASAHSAMWEVVAAHGRGRGAVVARGSARRAGHTAAERWTRRRRRERAGDNGRAPRRSSRRRSASTRRQGGRRRAAGHTPRGPSAAGRQRRGRPEAARRQTRAWAARSRRRRVPTATRLRSRRT